MSNPHNNTPNRPSGTNDDWHGSDVGYPPGMLWEGTVFPSGRDERIWGPQDPLDIIGPPGPFDDEHGAEAWRLANRHVWTGEARVLGPRPSEREQWYRNEYWAWHDARRARAGVSRGREQELVGYQDFQDALPVHPGVVNPSLTGNAPARTITAPPPATHAPVVSHETHTAPTPTSSLDGSYEEDDSYARASLPDSTPPKTSSPRGIDDWDDDNLLSLWKWKTIRKKGYAPMLEHFGGQTVETLAKAWAAHKQRCEELGERWRAAGRPGGSVGGGRRGDVG